MEKHQLLALIDKTKRQKANVLDLSNKGIAELPPEIGELSNLRTLLLAGNRLRSLPPQIGRLANLTYLDLHQNELMELPPQIGELTTLCHLDLSHNRLTELPFEVGRLSCLSILDVSTNRIAKLPWSIAVLPDLFYLDVRQNPLAEEIPSHSPDARAICSCLEVPGPGVRANEMGWGAGLRSCAVVTDGDLFEGLPVEEKGIVVRARLVGKCLTRVPPQIARLTALRILDLSLNQLTSLPREIGSLKSLRRLYLAENQISTLPEDIAMLHDLETLALARNSLSAMPRPLTKLRNLRRLDLSENNLRRLPPEIAELSNLRVLNLSGNALSELPREITELTQLEILDLRDNAGLNRPVEIAENWRDAQRLIRSVAERQDDRAKRPPTQTRVLGPMKICPACGKVSDGDYKHCPDDASPLLDRNQDPLFILGSIVAGRFKIEGTLGEGGFGVVYKAQHLHLKEWRALKFLHADHARDPERFARFRREAKALSDLNSEHITRFYDLEKDESRNLYFISMEFVDGEDLEKVLRRGALTWRQVITLMKQLCDALKVAHGKGVIHRDLKPTNIMVIRRGGVATHIKVCDFGIAKVLQIDEIQHPQRSGREQGEPKTHADTWDFQRRLTLGRAPWTPGYAPPEQLEEGREVDARTDLFAAGVIFYNLLTGRNPWTGRRADEEYGLYLSEREEEDLIIKPERLRPIPLRQYNPQIPTGLDALIVKLLEREPQRRYQSAQDVGRALTFFEETFRVAAAAEVPRLRRLTTSDVAPPTRAPGESPGPTSPIGFSRVSQRRVARVILGGIPMAALILVLYLGVVSILSTPTRDEATEPMKAPTTAPVDETPSPTRPTNTGESADRVEVPRPEPPPEIWTEIQHASQRGPDFRPERILTGHTDLVGAIAWSSNGHYLASASHDQTIRLWDVATGRELRTLTSPGLRGRGVAFTPDDCYLAWSSDADNVKVWEVATEREPRTLTGHTREVTEVTFSPDGRWLASGSNDLTIKLWEVESGRELRTLTGHTESVFSVDFSPDGSWLASGSKDDTIKLWEVASGRELRTLTGHTPSGIFVVAFSPNGRHLASGSFRKIKLWEMPTGRLLRTLTGLHHDVYGVTFSPDGRYLASASNDKTVKLWEVSSGRELRTLTGHTNWVGAVAFSPDGRRLASGSWDKTIRLWRLMEE